MGHCLSPAGQDPGLEGADELALHSSAEQIEEKSSMKKFLRVFVVTTLLLLANFWFSAGATPLGTDPSSVERWKKEKAAAEKKRETKEGKEGLKKATDAEKKPEGLKEAGKTESLPPKSDGTSLPENYFFVLKNGRQIGGWSYRTDRDMIYITTGSGEISLPRNSVIRITDAEPIFPNRSIGY